MSGGYAVMAQRDAVVAIAREEAAPELMLVGTGPRGAKGDPGGNIMAIGLFTDASGLAIPLGTDAVRTSGHTVTGIGIADYAWDGDVDAAYVADHPATSFIDTNGRGFRIGLPDEGVYLASWLGLRPSNSAALNRQILQSALFGSDALPAGATLRLGDGTYLIDDAIVGERGDITIDGLGWGLSEIAYPTQTTDNAVINIWGDNITMRRVRVTGAGNPAFANANSCVILGNGTTATQYKNWLVEDCWFDGAPNGIICTASQSASVIERPTGVRVRNCKASTKQQAVTMFGVDDAEITDIILDMPDTTPNNETEGVRILGSTNVRVKGVRGRSCGQFGFRLDVMNRGIFKLYNSDISIDGCNMTNVPQTAVMVSSCSGKFRLTNSVFQGTDEGLNDSTAVVFDTSGEADATIGDVVIQDNDFDKYMSGLLVSKTDAQSATKHVLYEGNRVRGNDSGAVYPVNAAVRSTFGSVTLLEIINNKFLLPANNAADIQFWQASADATVRVLGNTFQEGSPGVVVNWGFAVGAGPTAQLTSGDFTLASPTGVNGTGTLPDNMGDNTRYRSGAFAASA